MFTSCCPGWVNFIKKEYPQYADRLSTAKSPQQMFGAVTKSYYAEKLGVEPVFTVINWDNKVFELNGKGIDVVWNGMTITTAAQEAMECTNAYCNNAQVIVTK